MHFSLCYPKLAANITAAFSVVGQSDGEYFGQ